MKNHTSFSVVLLKESTVDKLNNEDNSKIFEESIVLIKETEQFFTERNEESLLEYFNAHIIPLEYINVYGENVVNKIVKVIEHFEIRDKIEFENFTEIYSRFIIGKIGDTPDMIMEKYFR